MDLFLEKVKSFVQQILGSNKILQKIVKDISSNGGNAILVGGSVRDLFLNIQIKDLDIEVYNLSLNELTKVLSNYGLVDFVGKSFGVLRLRGLDVDWSLPRRDSSGRKPDVTVDPKMSFQDAFKRRDLTINSMGIDLETAELIDPFNGLNDLNESILKATDPEFFIQDPLRLFRVMQFIGRFDMFPDIELNNICKKMDISGVSKERIEQEFTKLFLRSKKPSLGIRWLQQIGRLKDVLLELYFTIGVEQDHEWHPEGDVFEHSMQALDEASKLNFKDDYEKLLIMWAALAHDLGKVSTTKLIDGRLKSHGHDIAGLDLSRSMLNRITNNKDFIKKVGLLVRYHMQPFIFVKCNAGAAAYKRLALKIEPLSLELLSKLAFADRRGRVGLSVPKIDDQVVNKFVENAKQYQVLFAKEEPVVKGRDLVDFNFTGPEIGSLVKRAYKIQIEKDVKNKKQLLEYLLGKNYDLKGGK